MAKDSRNSEDVVRSSLSEISFILLFVFFIAFSISHLAQQNSPPAIQFGDGDEGDIDEGWLRTQDALAYFHTGAGKVSCLWAQDKDSAYETDKTTLSAIVEDLGPSLVDHFHPYNYLDIYLHNSGHLDIGRRFDPTEVFFLTEGTKNFFMKEEDLLSKKVWPGEEEIINTTVANFSVAARDLRNFIDSAIQAERCTVFAKLTPSLPRLTDTVALSPTKSGDANDLRVVLYQIHTGPVPIIDLQNVGN